MKSNKKCNKRLMKKKFIEFKPSNYNKLWMIEIYF